MKNIDELLKNLGIEIPKEKKADFEKEFFENYKTVNELELTKNKLSTLESAHKQLKDKYDTDIKQRDVDLENVKSQLEKAGVDKTKLEELTNSLSTLKTNYDNEKKEYEAKLAKQKKEFLIKELVGKLNFSSNGAKSDFLNKALNKEFAYEGDSILGFDDFTNAYKEQDPGAFVISKEEPAKPTPQIFSGKTGSINKGDNETTQVNKPRPIIW